MKTIYQSAKELLISHAIENPNEMSKRLSILVQKEIITPGEKLELEDKFNAAL